MKFLKFTLRELECTIKIQKVPAAFVFVFNNKEKQHFCLIKLGHFRAQISEVTCLQKSFVNPVKSVYGSRRG